MQGCKVMLILGLCLFVATARLAAQESSLQQAKRAFDRGDFTKTIEILKDAAAKEPSNGDIQLLLAKSYLETKQYDNAVRCAEKAVAANPKSSIYHQWLGEAYGEKADHASMLSAYSLARKTHKEFESAVDLDARNFDAAQDLIEFDCTAPGMVGGGEDKALPLIQKLMGLDPAEGHFGSGVCRAIKKDLVSADAEYAKALEIKPKTADRIYDIGDYFIQREQGEMLLAVATAGEALVATDPRGMFYRAAGWILRGEKYPEAEKLLREYLQAAPPRSNYPGPWDAHYWIGRARAAQKDSAGAKSEYHEALKFNPKYKKAQEALKQLGGN
jgi:tetratricopeptide (TPR) repeat protein